MTPEEHRAAYPCGTLEEILKLGLDPSATASCSEPRGGRNRGCTWWAKCAFRETRDANDGRGAGPENYGLEHLPFGAFGNGVILPCYSFHGAGAVERMQQTHKSGDLYSRFYKVGEKVQRRTTQRLHPKAEPGCHRCVAKNCMLMHDVVELVTIQPFPRPGADPESREGFRTSLLERIVGDVPKEEAKAVG